MKALVFLLWVTPLFAVTEVEVLNSVILHYPSIQASEAKLDAAEGELTAAKGAFDHKLKHKTRLWRQYPYNNEFYETFIERQTALAGAKLSVGHRQGAGEFNYYDLKKQTSTAGQIFAGITLPLLRNLQTDDYRTNLRISELQKKQGQQELRLKKLLSVHKALSTYYKWILECKKLEINRQILELAKTRQDMITRKFKAGDADRLKVTDVIRQINKRESELIKNSVDERKYALELSLYFRNKDGVPVVPETLTAPEAQLQKETLTAQLRSTDVPQTNLLTLEQEIQNLQYRLSEQSRLPGLNVGVLGGRELSDRPGYGDHLLEVGVSFDFPLENRKAEGKTVAAHYKRLAIEKELTLLRQQLTQQVALAKLSAQNARARFKIQSEEFANTSRVALGERKKWQYGSTDMFVVNLREQDVADVDIRRWTAMYDYHQANLDAGLFSGQLPTDPQ